jgi:hypothetical protein
VTTRDRHTYSTRIRCRERGKESERCRACGAQYMRTSEKGIDAAIVTDLLVASHLHPAV